jgi:hypothetical protein
MARIYKVPTPIYDRVDRSGAMIARQYVEERFREMGWCDKNQPYSVTDIKADLFPDAYHVIVRVPVKRRDIPDEMLQLADEVEEELVSRGYPTLVIVRPTMLPVATT